MGAVPRFDRAPGERLRPLREIKAETGHLLAGGTNHTASTQQAPMLAVEGLSKAYPIRKAGLFGSQPRRVAALDDVSFEVRRGECLGLVGESGCGKTTLSKEIGRAHV